MMATASEDEYFLNMGHMKIQEREARQFVYPRLSVLSIKNDSKNGSKQDWRDNSVVQSTDYSCRWPHLQRSIHMADYNHL